MKYWVLLSLAVVSEVIATSALKSSEGFSKLGPSIVVMIGFASATYFLSLTLKVIPVGVAYAVWAGMGIVIISLIGRFFFNQHLDMPAYIGIGFILVGVIIMRVFSQAVGN